MDTKLMIQIEESINKLSKKHRIQKLDFDTRASIDLAIQNRMDLDNKENLYDFLCSKLKERHYVKKSGLLDEAGFYTYARISSNTWSNIRWGNVKPSKETLLKLIIGLKMTEKDADKLMELGHNALDLSDPRDRLILALIDIRCYDISTVYEVLEEYGKYGAQPFSNIY